MSVRAYRVIEILTAKPESFNLYHDVDLATYLDSHYGFFEQVADWGTGLVEVSVESLIEAIGNVKLDAGVKERLLRDIQIAQEQGSEYIQYLCY